MVLSLVLGSMKKYDIYIFVMPSKGGRVRFRPDIKSAA
jgi:hypothetical protein